MTPKLPKEYSDFRRQQILEAAWDCFAEKGYAETTIREVAKRMNASTGVIYNYFKGKEEILEAIHDWSVENNKQMFNQIGKKETVRKALLEFFKSSLECCPVNELKNGARSNISMWAEALKRENIRKVVNSYYKDREKNVVGFMKEGIEKKEINADFDPKVMAGFFLALMIGLQLQIALIDGVNTRTYIKEIKKILFTNIWTEA